MSDNSWWVVTLHFGQWVLSLLISSMDRLRPCSQSLLKHDWSILLGVQTDTILLLILNPCTCSHMQISVYHDQLPPCRVAPPLFIQAKWPGIPIHKCLQDRAHCHGSSYVSQYQTDIKYQNWIAELVTKWCKSYIMVFTDTRSLPNWTPTWHLEPAC